MKKIIILLCVAFLFVACFSGFALADETTDYSIDEKEALSVAYNFIVSNIASQSKIDYESDLKSNGYENCLVSWREGVIITKVTPLNSMNETIAAYMIELGYENDESAGYVIVSADKRYSPIIEFSYSQEHFLYNAVEEILEEDTLKDSGDKSVTETIFYYVGQFEYALSVKNTSDINKVYYDLSTGIPVKSEKGVLKQKEETYSKAESLTNSYEWDSLLYDSTEGSNPPTGVVIYIPANYESGWEETTYDWCYGMGNSYFTTSYSGFLGGSNCAPTAGTNIMKYWTLRDPDSFSDLYNGSWATVHNTLYDYMGTNDGITGTYDSSVGPAIEDYISENCGGTPYAPLKTYCNTVSEFDTYIKYQINNGRPVILHLHDDDNYSDHTVVGFGYIRYKYSGSWTSHYILIADGWSGTPNRYIHYQTGRDHLNVTRVYPE